MTVVSTIITRHYTAHASDSFLTVRRPDGGRAVVEDQQSKLVRVPAWRGVMGYWGLARHEGDWQTLEWLRTQANRAHESLSVALFAGSLAMGLTDALAGRSFAKPVDAGLGVHFTAYERVDDRWIPELFVITNWTDSSYTAIRPQGFRATRETYAILKGLEERPTEHGEANFRLEVHAALHGDGIMFRFNNGDPILFNPIANAIIDSFIELSRRRNLKDPTSCPTHLSIARSPVDVVSKLLAELSDPNMRLIGGKPHDLAVSPGGEYESRTGD